MRKALSIWIFATIGSVASAMSSDGPAACQRALIATGLDWLGSAHSKTLEAAHPAYSPTAQSIYFAYEIPGLTIHLEQGPHEGMHMSGNKIRRFYLAYDPEFFVPGSYLRRMFGRKSLRVTESDVGRHYWTNSLVTDPEGDQICTIYVPRKPDLHEDSFDLDSAQLLISRSTGKVFGYGPRSKNVLGELAHGLWMELRNPANTRRHGRGIWFNSDSNLPAPTFGHD